MKAFVLDATWDPRPDYKPTPVELETRRANIGSSVWRHLTSAFKEIDTPKPGPDDVIIKQRRVGFCGSDMHFFEHDADGLHQVSRPRRASRASSATNWPATSSKSARTSRTSRSAIR